MNRETQRTFFIGAFLAIGICLMTLAGWRGAVFQSFELAVYDCVLRAENRVTAAAESRVTILGLSEADVRRYGWPLSDRQLAHALTRLDELGARVIGLDLYRDLPEPRTGEDKEFIRSALHEISSVVAIYGVGARTGPPPVLADAPRRIGFNDLPADVLKLVRRGLLFMDVEGAGVVPSFALQIAAAYLEKDGIVPECDSSTPEHMRLGRVTFRPFESNDGAYVGADDGGYQFLIDGRGPRLFPTFSLEQLNRGQVPLTWVRDRIVLVGVTAESVRDVVTTSFDEVRYGVELHALLVDQLLRAALLGHAPIRDVPEWLEGCWIAAWGFGGGFLGWTARSPWHFAVRFTAAIAALLLVFWSAFSGGWWIPAVAPVAAVASSAVLFNVYRVWEEHRKRSSLMRTFGRHVSREAADWIWREEQQLDWGAERRSQAITATILFSDLKDFTTISERLPPETIGGWINDYMSMMAPLVTQHSGSVNKFIGDAIMAVFGIPDGQPRCVAADAIRAVECAFAMEEALGRLNANWELRGLPRARMRIGIYTGTVAAGCVGASERMEFTVLGDAVNTASRLESLDHRVADPDRLATHCRILIGEPTRNLVGDSFEFEDIGSIRVKGKEHSVRIYRAIARKRSVTRSTGEYGRLTAVAALMLGTALAVAQVQTETETETAGNRKGHRIAPNRAGPTITNEVPARKLDRVSSRMATSESNKRFLPYKPPARGAPRVRVNAGSRSNGTHAPVYVLAPDFPGATMRPQPVLYGYLPVGTALQVEFALVLESEPEPLLEIVWEGHAAGLIRIEPAEWDVELQLECTYRWSIALVPDPESRSKDIVAAGMIRHVAPTAASQGGVEANSINGSNAQLDSAIDRFWYDALDRALVDLSRDGESVSARDQLNGLLEQAGLESLAKFLQERP